MPDSHRPPTMASPALEPSATRVEETTLDGVALFVLGGEFDAFSSPPLRQQLIDAIERGSHEVVLDMSAVTFVDMSTLNRIVRTMKEIYRHNGHLVLACGDKHVLRAIELAGLRHSVRVYPTREEAVEHLKDRNNS